MKKSIILVAAIMLSASFVNAQSSDPELDYIRAEYSKEKKLVVDEFLKLNTEDHDKFSQVYNAFEHERHALATKRLDLIKKYVDNLDKLTPESADKLANELLSNNINLEKLNLKFYGKMKTAVGAINAAKFIQLETYFQTTWRSFVQDNIPMIGELDKQKKD